MSLGWNSTVTRSHWDPMAEQGCLIHSPFSTSMYNSCLYNSSRQISFRTFPVESHIHGMSHKRNFNHFRTVSLFSIQFKKILFTVVYAWSSSKVESDLNGQCSFNIQLIVQGKTGIVCLTPYSLEGFLCFLQHIFHCFSLCSSFFFESIDSIFEIRNIVHFKWAVPLNISGVIPKVENRHHGFWKTPFFTAVNLRETFTNLPMMTSTE